MVCRLSREMPPIPRSPLTFSRAPRSPTSASTRPTRVGPSCFRPFQAGVLEGAVTTGAKLVSLENLYMYGPTGGAPLTEDLPYAAAGPKGLVRA